VKNRTEARKEFERQSDPNYRKSQKRNDFLKYKERKSEELRKAGVGEDEKYVVAVSQYAPPQLSRHGADGIVIPPCACRYLLQSAEQNQQKKAKLDAKRANKAAFGWDVFNQDTLYRAFEKRQKKLPQHRPKDDGSFEELLGPGQAPKPKKEQLVRMINELKERDEARKKFSRRRAFNEDATVSLVLQVAFAMLPKCQLIVSFRWSAVVMLGGLHQPAQRCIQQKDQPCFRQVHNRNSPELGTRHCLVITLLSVCMGLLNY